MHRLRLIVLLGPLLFAGGCASHIQTQTQNNAQARIDRLERRVAELEAKAEAYGPWAVVLDTRPMDTHANGHRPWWDPEPRIYLRSFELPPEMAFPAFGLDMSDELVRQLIIGPSYDDWTAPLIINYDRPLDLPWPRYDDGGLRLRSGVFGDIELEPRVFEIPGKADHAAGAIRLPNEQ